MADDAKKVAVLIDSISHKREHLLRFPMMSGTVVAGSLDDVEMTVSVILSTDDADTPTEDINLNVVLNNTAGMYLIPSDGAYCIIGEIDGAGKWELLKASAYTKIMATIGAQTFVMDGTKVDVKDGSGGELTMQGGMFTLKNGSGSLGAILAQVMTDLIGAGVIAGGYPGTFNPATITNLTTDKTKLAAILT
jgi:hypothetical protein